MATYHISPLGNDSNPGTIGSPFLTFVKAETVVAAGDTVLIANGTYAGMTTSLSGTGDSNRITYRATTPGAVYLYSAIISTHNYRNYDGFVFNDVGDRSFDVIGANNKFLNITININYGTGYGIKIGVDANTGGEAADNNLIDNLRIVSTFAGAQTVHGVLFGGGGSGNTIRNSYISNTYYGIVDKVCSGTLVYNCVFNFTHSGLYVAVYSKGSSDTTCLHNTYRMTGGGYGVIMAPSDGGSPESTGALIANNIFIKGSDAAIYNAGAGTFTSDYNLFQYSSGTLVIDGSGYATLTAWQVSGQDANSIAATPVFVNASGLLTQLTDYKPAAASPVINTGTTSVRTLDAGGNAVVSAPDIGPWEYSPSGNVYYIATDGDDANPGTLAQPWLHIEKINTISLLPGDIVNIRAGTYDSYAPLFAGTVNNVLINNKSGTASAHITIQGYPPDFTGGGRVVYNCLNVTRSSGAIGIHTLDCSYMDFSRISVVGPAQVAAGSGGTYTGCWWFAANTSKTNVTATNCEASFAETGFRLDNVNNVTYTNCDAHEIDDPYTGPPTGPHNNSDGFSRTNALNTATGTVYRGCRAWFCSDDGWDCFDTAGSIVYDHCWAFWNGYLPGFIHSGDGNGFKQGPNNGTTGFLRTTTFCLAAGNYNHGFDQNAGTATAKQFNNSSINNGANDWKYGFNPPLPHQFRNNLSYGNALIDGITSDADDWGLNDYNSWNGGVTLTADDFVSLDDTELDGARQADGSLPVITYAHLAADSDLIDAGIDIGYAFNGTAPDMGAFEFGDPLPEGTVTELTVAFTECDDGTTGGYQIFYRVAGDEEWIDGGIFFSSPAVITGLSYPSGTIFEAQGINLDCDEESGSGSGSGSNERFAVAGEDDFGQQERYFSFDDLANWNFTYDLTSVDSSHEFRIINNGIPENDSDDNVSFVVKYGGVISTVSTVDDTILSRYYQNDNFLQLLLNRESGNKEGTITVQADPIDTDGGIESILTASSTDDNLVNCLRVKNYATELGVSTSYGKPLHIYNNTVVTPAAVTGGVALYAAGGAGASELHVIDESGNDSTLSPHNFSGIPEGQSDEMAWSYYCEKNGEYINVDMLRVIRKLEELTGEKFIYQGKKQCY